MDGNKRLALTSLAVFLMLNRYAFYVARDEAVQFTVRLASVDDLDIWDVSKWIRRNAIRFDRFLSMPDEEAMRWAGVVAGSLTYLPRSIQLFKDFILSEGDG